MCGDARTRGRQQRAGSSASRRGGCSDSSNSAASGDRRGRMSLLLPWKRSSALGMPSAPSRSPVCQARSCLAACDVSRESAVPYASKRAAAWYVGPGHVRERAFSDVSEPSRIAPRHSDITGRVLRDTRAPTIARRCPFAERAPVRVRLAGRPRAGLRASLEEKAMQDVSLRGRVCEERRMAAGSRPLSLRVSGAGVGVRPQVITEQQVVVPDVATPGS